MSWEDEHIDNLFRETTSNQKVEFKDEFWSEFEKMLPEKKQKRKGVIFWWFGASIVTLIVVLYSAVNFSNLKIKEIKNRKAIVQNEKGKLSVEKNASIANVNAKKNENHVSKNVFLPKREINSQNKYSNNFKNKKESKNENFTSLNSINEDSRLEVLAFNNHNFRQLESLKDMRENEDLILSLKSISIFTTATINNSNFTKSKFKKWHPYLDVYYSLNQSPISNTELGSNFSHGLGIGSGFLYSSKSFTFSCGLNLASQNYSNLMINDRAKVYGFGVTNYEQNINYNNFYLIEMPLYAGLKSSKHQIQIGLVTSYLLNTKLKYQLKEEELITQSGNYYNYRKGLNAVYFKPSLKYAFKLAPTVQIGAVIQLQVNPVLNDIKLFTGIENGHPINGQIFIRKTLH